MHALTVELGLARRVANLQLVITGDGAHREAEHALERFSWRLFLFRRHSHLDGVPTSGRTESIPSRQRHVGGTFGQLLAETALIKLRHQRSLELVTLVKERQSEGEADVAEDFRVLGPGHHGAGTHHSREITVD